MTEGPQKTYNLSIVIPLYNESHCIKDLELDLSRFIESAIHLQSEIIFVNDGSTDSTGSQLNKLKGNLENSFPNIPLTIKVIHLDMNIGKGGALRAGVLSSRGEWVLTLDADMATKFTQVLDWEKSKFIDLKIPSNTCKTVFIGSREHSESIVKDKLDRRFIGRCFNFFVQIITSLYTDDSQCGFKLYPRHIAKYCFEHLREVGWAHDVEILTRTLGMGCRFISLPIRWKAGKKSKVNPLKDAARMFIALFRIRISFYFFDRLKISKNRSIIRSQTARANLFYERLSFALFILLTAIIFTTFHDYGISWDEYAQNSYGNSVLRYYTSLFENKEAWHFGNLVLHGEYFDGGDLYLYGGLFDGLTAFFNLFSPFGEYETRHLVNGLVGLLGILGCFKLGRFFGGVKAGFWAAFLLALTCSYWGHMFFNPKDIPFAVGYVWSIYYLVQWIQYLPAVPIGLVVKLGIAIGLTLGIRVGGLVLLAYLSLVVSLYILRSLFMMFLQKPVNFKRQFWQLAKGTFACAILSYAIMLFCWPWAQQKPLLNPMIALGKITHFTWRGTALFQGRLVSPENIPWNYIVQYMLIKLPEILLFFFAIGLIFCTVYAVKAKQHPEKGLTLNTWSLLLFTIVFPISYVIFRKSFLYDGMRQFLFLIPLIACVSGTTIALIYEKIIKGRKIASVLFSCCLLLYIVFHLTQVLRLHPYQYVYFNQMVGGLPGAYGKYDTDYWGISLKEGVENLVQHLKKNEKDTFENKTYYIKTAAHPLSSTYYFPSNFKYTSNANSADFFIAITRWNYHRSILKGTFLFAVERLGVPLTIVKDLRSNN